ncbi:peptidase M64 [bacterium]|nr:peptidase M64 [bacterium]
MKKILWLVLLMLPQLVFAEFSTLFRDQTLRIDYVHTGGKNTEIISVDQIYSQGVWAGSKTNLIDILMLGKYQYRLLLAKNDSLIYSRGFSSVYGEWETTAEAQRIYCSFHETALVPQPKKPVKLALAKRNKLGRFEEIWRSPVIDPDSRFVNREPLPSNVKVETLKKNGSPSEKVDLLFLGDGYSKKEMRLFKKDVRHFVKTLFSAEPFKSRESDFNVRAVLTPSAHSGVDEPRQDVWKNTAFDCSFNTFDLPRYVLTLGNKKVRDAAAQAPYDFMIILFNSPRYGGGGIYNLYAISYSGKPDGPRNWIPDYVLVHEFGHCFGGLGDEYYSSAVVYEDFYPAGVEPWEPNLTTLLPGQDLKWQELVEPGTPIPTPWNKAGYDSLAAKRSALDRNAANYAGERRRLEIKLKSLLKAEPYWGKVGAFEGGGYLSEGVYRPALDCQMFSRTTDGFDPVCQAAIERMIDFYSRKESDQ